MVSIPGHVSFYGIPAEGLPLRIPGERSGAFFGILEGWSTETLQVWGSPTVKEEGG